MEKSITARHVAELSAENAKLREEVRYLKKGDVLHVLTDQEFAEQQKHKREMQASIKALDDENAKLRELVSDFWTDMNTCHLNGDVPNERDLDFYRPRVHEFGITDISERELRVEVDA